MGDDGASAGNGQLLLTFEELLDVFFGEDGAAGVGGVGNDQAGRPLVDQALQVREVDLPRLFWLRTNRRALSISHATDRLRRWLFNLRFRAYISKPELMQQFSLLPAGCRV